jgi:hypothetical protein
MSEFEKRLEAGEEWNCESELGSCSNARELLKSKSP